MAKEAIIPNDVAEVRKKYWYSHAIKAGNTIYLAGQVAWDEKGNLVGKGDPAVQMRQIYENIRRVLKASGATMQDIVKLTYYCRDISLVFKTTGAFKEYFGDHYPPSTMLQISRLWHEDYLFEVDATAVVDK